MRTALDIHALYKDRVESMGLWFAQMREVRDTYNGDVVLPLPELDSHEKAAVANLTQQGLDQMARRIASVLPNAVYPPLRSGIKDSESKARTRKSVTLGWWAEADLKTLMGFRGRFWLGYGCAPAVVRPNHRTGVPRWEAHSPLDTFPAPMQLGEVTPDDCIFTTTRTLGWLNRNYPVQAQLLHKAGSGPVKDDMEFALLEYVDAEQNTLVVCGQDPSSYDIRQPIPGTEALVLESLENRAGVCWAVVPGRLTLDRPMGHFDGILGMYQTQAMLMAMEVIATRRAIWPREWVVAAPNETPQIIQRPDPGLGIPGLIKGGVFDRQNLDPTFRADQTMDRLEYAQRQTAGLPAELGGMSSSNVRTGRRGAQVFGEAIDFTIAEAQDSFAKAIEAETRRAIAIDKAYFREPKSYYISTRAFKGKVDYTPKALWECDPRGRVPLLVEYPMSGADLQNIVLEGGQRVGMGTMSKRTFMEMDPAVSDADAEMDRIKSEELDMAFFASVQSMAANPDGPWQPVHLARLKQMIIAEDVDWEDAVTKLQEEIQAEQATPAPEMAPETMPGLSMPGMGVEAPAAVPEMEPSMQNLTSLLSSLGTTQMALKSRG